MEERGQILVYTGEGKGKTTASLGIALRAVGQGKSVVVIQFIKSPERTVGERAVLEKIGVNIHPLGIGFTWTKTPEEHRAALKEAWTFAKEMLNNSNVDVLILDELNNALGISRFSIEDIVPIHEVLQALNTRNRNQHVIITGRGAKKEIIDIADLVTEMTEVKHYYKNDVAAVVGIDY